MADLAIADVASLALCWRLERSDGAGIALTGHDETIVRDGDRYEPSLGIVPASVSRGLGLDAQAGEISGGLGAGSLDEEDLASGRWDGARAVLTALDWSDLNGDATELVHGQIGSVRTEDSGFSAELNGASALLDRPVCPSTSPQCRADLGDDRCSVDLRGRTRRMSVLASDAGELTLDGPVDESVLLGRLRYLSGANCGLSTVIVAVAGGQVHLRDLPRLTVEPGCRVELRTGCDKTFATCCVRFGNAVNFRGEPHLPGTDLLTRYPGA